MPALDQVHLDAGELPLDVCSRAEGLLWVEASQQWLDRHIYSIFSVFIHEIAHLDAMSKKVFMCSNYDMFGSLKENLTLKQAALLKFWPVGLFIQSHGWLG